MIAISLNLVIGPITFLAPLALLGLLILPLIWWILQVTPPQPKDAEFPPLRILQDVMTEEETPDSTPLWLLLFRLLDMLYYHFYGLFLYGPRRPLLQIS